MELTDRILKSKGQKPVAVPCPEWGGDVVLYVHPLTGAERDEIERESDQLLAAADFATGAGRHLLKERVIVRCVRDVAGQRVFGPEHVDALSKLDGRPTDRLYRVADHLSAVSDREIDTLLGKSDGAGGPPSSSGSASAST